MDQFTQAYIKAALWLTTVDCDDYGPDDLSPELLEQITTDCKKFQADYGHLWADAVIRYRDEYWSPTARCWQKVTTSDGINREWTVDEQAGHDFWLTRNSLGAGFWDKPELYGEDNAEKLTEVCKAFGEVPLYVEDGKIYGE